MMYSYDCNNMERLKFLSKIFKPIATRIIFFGRNSSIAGLKYVFEENGSKLSRLLWLLILLTFTGCLYLQLVEVVEQNDEVDITPDTLYLRWSTTFPAVTVCELYSPKIVLSKLDALYPHLLKSLSFDSKHYVADLIYGRGLCGRSHCEPCGTVIPCDVPWRHIIDIIHKKCDEMIADCRFNNVEFPCCKHFGMVDSQYGTCFSFNSLQRQNSDGLLFAVNRTTGPGVLTFRLLNDAEISIHSTEELSTVLLDKKLKLDVKTNLENDVDFLFSIIEINNDPLFQYEDVEVRRCRYNHEIPNGNLHTYQVYSYGACRLALNTKRSFENCGCVHPVRDLSYKNLYCNYTGINCLSKYDYEELKIGKGATDDTEECLPSCVESELKKVHVSRRLIKSEQNGAQINVKMVSLPTLRYQKNLLRTNTDFVVTVGGLVGLFFSASILSVAEIIYLLLRKPK